MTAHTGVCLDLGAFDPRLDDAGVGAWLSRAQGLPAWVVVMEDRQPVFFHGHRDHRPDAPVPLNRHGPHPHPWTHADLRRLVDAFHARGVRVLLGYWTHECAFVDESHPELLIRDASGALWQDRVEMNADFSPLRRMRADPEADVREGERYAEWAVRQYARLHRDFGFDGLFLGDGAMGFRRHGMDWKDLRWFDYHEDWLAEFRVDVGFSPHEGCALLDDEAPTPQRARDVHEHHWDHWVRFNTQRWTDFYRTMAEGVHATGGMLAAYNCMNYDPALARLHGVDYRAIAEAGLDVLVFQAYDHAWGPNGPFGFLDLRRKDLATNLEAMLRTRAHVGYDTPMKIVFTIETEDEVEGWDAPLAHTLGETIAHGLAMAHDGTRWRRAADGAFVVWGNSVREPEWRHIQRALTAAAAPCREPAGVLTTRADEATALAAQGVPTATQPDELYAHMGHDPGADAILTAAVPARPRAR